MQVKTDIGALFAGLVISAVLAVTALGDGGPPKGPAKPAIASELINPDPSIEGLRQIPPPVHGRSTTASTPTTPSSTLDSYVWEGLRGGLAYIAVFVLAHLTLRRARIGGRWPYAMIGSASTLASIISLTLPRDWSQLIRQGNLSEYLGITLATGAILGFLYQWRAGLEANGDDPVVLARALGATQNAAEPAAGRPLGADERVPALPMTAL